MAAPTYPPVLLEPIAADAGGAYITNPIPESPTGSNAASVQGGFPPITMQPELGGGEPPLGQDFNGFLFMITTHTVWVQSGQLYLFSSELAADIGGYAVGTVLGMADGSGMWICVAANNTTNPDTGGAGWRAIYSYGSATVAITTGTVFLTAQQAKKPVIIFTGVLTGNVNAVLPGFAQQWLIVNATSGAFVLTVSANGGGAGATVTVPQGGFASPLSVYSIGDGNLYPSVAPLSIPIDQAATPLTIVERTNAGYVLATYFNGSAAAENPTIVNVIVDAGDGYFRKIATNNFQAQFNVGGWIGQVLNGQVPYSAVQQWAAALFTSPSLTGVPTAPTAAAGTATSQIATTAFVNPGSSISGNGWRQNSDGTIEQWGTFAWTANGGSTTIAFPRTFPNNVFSVVIGAPVAVSGLGGAGSYQADQPAAPTTANFQYRSVSSSNPAITVHWRAIGN